MAELSISGPAGEVSVGCRRGSTKNVVKSTIEKIWVSGQRDRGESCGSGNREDPGEGGEIKTKKVLDKRRNKSE